VTLEAEARGAAVAIGGAGVTGLHAAEDRRAGAVLAGFVGGAANDAGAAAAEPAGIAVAGAECVGAGAPFIGRRLGGGARAGGIRLGRGAGVGGGGAGGDASIAGGAGTDAIAAAGAVGGRIAAIAPEADEADTDQAGEPAQDVTSGRHISDMPCEIIKTVTVHRVSSCD
jgi:hypothetical protein